MKKSIPGLLVTVVLLTGCAGGAPEAAEEPVVKPQNAAQEEVDDSDGQNNTTSKSIARLVSDLREQEAINRENKEVIEIEEKIYLSQMTDIYMNTEDYIGRTLSIEGYMLTEDIGDDIDDENAVGAVVRNTPGCCGDDGITGFSYIWAGDAPAEDEWIRVTGVLSLRTNGDQIYMVLEAEDVEIKTERGLEFIGQ